MIKHPINWPFIILKNPTANLITFKPTSDWDIITSLDQSIKIPFLIITKFGHGGSYVVVDCIVRIDQSR